LNVRSSSHLFGFGGLPLGTRDLHPLSLFSVRCNSHHRKAAGPSTCYECGQWPQTCPGRLECLPGFRRRYLRLLGVDGKFAPVPRRTRNEVRLDHRGVLQDQLYAKTLGVRQSRRATLSVLQARSFLCYSPLLSKHHQTRALSPPRPASSRCQSSCRRGKTRTSSTAWGVHWMLEPFGWSVRCAARMRSRPPPYLPEDAQ
jgi:hypothetical protein